MKEYKNVDEYIASFPGEIQALLKKMRTTIKRAAPGAEEGISYGMPVYRINNKPVVYFGGFRKHLGFYATPTGHAEFAKELSRYKQGRGSVQFPTDKPLPLDLVEQITKFRVLEVTGKIKGNKL